MNQIKFYKNQGFYLMAVVCILVLISLCMYGINGATQFNKETIASSVIAMGVVSIILSLVSIAADIFLPGTKLEFLHEYTRFIKYVVWLMLLYGFLELIVTEFNFIGNVFVSTDPVDTLFIVNYLVALIPMLLASVCAIVSGTLQRVSAFKAGR